MIVLLAQLAPWDKIQEFTKFSGGKPIGINDFSVDDFIIAKIGRGIDLLRIIKIEDRGEDETILLVDPRKENDSLAEEDNELKFVLHKASVEDLEKNQKKFESKNELLEKCDSLIKKYKLQMKLVDVMVSYDGGRITFAFTANSRVDFRNLVRDLAKEFHKSIRLRQLGKRQELELKGDMGPCGNSLCCFSFLKKLGNVGTELIFDQQIAHRGIDRLSGVCGRLKCCLLYEEDQYKEIIDKMPSINSIVDTIKGKGRVVSRQILKQIITVELEDKGLVDFPLDQIKLINPSNENEKN